GGTNTTRWRAGTAAASARRRSSASSPTSASTRGCSRPGRARSRTSWSLRRETIATTGRPATSPSALRAAARSAGGTAASTRSRAMPFGTTRSRPPGCSRRRSARATAWLTAMVRSAASPTATSSRGEVLTQAEDGLRGAGGTALVRQLQNGEGPVWHRPKLVILVPGRETAAVLPATVHARAVAEVAVLDPRHILACHDTDVAGRHTVQPLHEVVAEAIAPEVQPGTGAELCLACRRGLLRAIV